MKRLARLALLALGSIFVPQCSHAAANGCPQIDPKNVDVDGMPLCPDEVLSSPQSFWSVYSCAIAQATSFHAPTPAEKSSMVDLLTTYKKVTEKGISADSTKSLLSSAASLNLQVCRAKQNRSGAVDSFLLFYVKPGVKDYSGPFMGLRETAHSKLLLIGPHDDSDGTFADTKFALAETSALAIISNGHKRGKVGDPNGDFVHEPVSQNLGTFVVQQLGQLFSGYVVLHIHGWSSATKILIRCRNDILQNAFEKAVMTETKLSDFGPLNADFTIDPLVNTDYYLKTEMTTKMHEGNRHALAKIVSDLEQYSWAKLP